VNNYKFNNNYNIYGIIEITKRHFFDFVYIIITFFSFLLYIICLLCQCPHENMLSLFWDNYYLDHVGLDFMFDEILESTDGDIMLEEILPSEFHPNTVWMKQEGDWGIGMLFDESDSSNASMEQGEDLGISRLVGNIILVSPVKIYSDSEAVKKEILQDNKGKPGIYRWINKINGNSYVGSAVNLSKRLTSYYSVKELAKNTRPIQDALLKHGHKNFSLEILEYCDKTSLIKREQYYLDLLIPEYNILKYAYSVLGYKHTQETIEKLKEKIVSPEHKMIISSIHKGKLVSEDTRKKLAAATSEYRKTNPLSAEALANLKAKGILRQGVAISVLNTNTNETKEFSNQTEAGEFLGISRQAVYNAVKRGSIVKDVYLLKKII